MPNNHALTIQARTLLSQTAVLDVALLETLNRIVTEEVHLLEGYKNLHVYCVSCLGMSDDSVARRRRAADLLMRYPTLVRPMIEARAIHLTGLAMLQPVINDANAERLLHEARGKTKAEIELMVVRENPKPALTSAVTRVSTPTTGAKPVSREEEKSTPALPLALTAQPQASLFSQTASVQREEPVPLPRAKPIEVRAPDVFQFRAMMTAETKKVLDDVLDLATDRDLNVVLRHALESLRTDLRVHKRAALRREPNGREPNGREPNGRKANRRKANGRKTTDQHEDLSENIEEVNEAVRVSRTGTSAKEDGGEMVAPDGEQRYVPAPVRRFVFERDNGQCQFVNPETGHTCCATADLHLHHIKAWAKGGKTTAENLVVFCRSHNLYEGRREFGARREAS